MSAAPGTLRTAASLALARADSPVLASSRPYIPRVSARYEGATFSTSRSILPAVIQSARKDMAASTRRRLLANSRYLKKNNPLVSAIIERLVVYTVGTGIILEPDTSDAAWNKKAARAWEGWSRRASLTTRQTFGQLQAVMLRSALVDGDCFLLKTFSASGRPRVQLIESHEIGDPDTALPDDTSDGVQFDGQGRPSAFTMPAGGGLGADGKPVARAIPADQLAMLANIERPNQHRGICLWASAITTAIDLHDLLALEKAGVKAAGAITDVIKTTTGEIDADDLVRGSVSTSGDTPEAQARFYREVFGPEAKVLKTGDEHAQYVNQRPSGAWVGFVDFLAELCCLAFNLPPSMVRQLKVGGADTRRDLATAQRVVELWQELVASVSQDVYEYVIDAEIQDGALAGAPADWRATSTQYPRAMTVDAGRQAQQDRADVQAGTLTMQEYCGQYGTNYRRHLRQLAREEQEIAELEQAEGLEPGSIASRLYSRPAPVATHDPATL